MHQAVAYILMNISAAFYCGFDASFKEKAAEHSYIASNSTYQTECEALDCYIQTLKLYDSERGKIIEEGFLTMAAAVTNFNSNVIDKLKKLLNQCLPDVNQKINSLPLHKCNKFQVGISLLESCLRLNKIEFASQH